MSISSTLNTAKLGLLAQSRAIQVASNNIANVNTPGYTRQRAIFEAVSPSFLPGGTPQGGGSTVGQVERVADAVLDAQILQEHQGLAYDTTLEAGLRRLESVFDELGGSGLSTALSNFFSAVNDLSSGDASNAVLREQVVQTGTAIADQIRDMDNRLHQLQIGQNAAISQQVTDINGIAIEIAELNRDIFKKEVGGNTVASSLRDTRQARMIELGKKVDFTSFERSDGQVSIFVGGGFLLVDGITAGSLSADTTQSSTLSDPSFSHIFQSLDGSLNGPITSRITSGEMGATLDLRDTQIVDYRQELDEFAYNLARRFNDVHDNGYGLNDNTQRIFFVDPTQTDLGGGPDFAAVAGAAAVIDVYATIQTDPQHVAAGLTSVGGAGANPGDNANAVALAALENSRTGVYLTGDAIGAAVPSTNPTHTLGSVLSSLAGRLGSAVQGATRQVAQGDLTVSQLTELRESVSGVSIDEEVTQLIAYERAYQASARVIQIADGLLERLLSI